MVKVENLESRGVIGGSFDEDRGESSRRSRVSILRDILRTINNKGGRAKPTHILYGANLSYDRLKKHLEYLEAEGFVKKNKVEGKSKSYVKGKTEIKIESKTENGGQTYYEITKKGLEFLSGYNKMKKFFDAFGFSV